jgi:hypothetical protein
VNVTILLQKKLATAHGYEAREKGRKKFGIDVAETQLGREKVCFKA